MVHAVNLVLTASLITFTSWLSRRQPRLAGFLLSLPLSTLIALALSHQQNAGSPEKVVAFAKSIFLSIPLTLLFFVPFLLAEKLAWPFWALYGAGLALLVVSYFLHSALA